MKFKKHVVPFAKYLARKFDVTLGGARAALPGHSKCEMIFTSKKGFRLLMTFNEISSKQGTVIAVNFDMYHVDSNEAYTELAKHTLYYPYEYLYLSVEQYMAYLLKMYPVMCASYVVEVKTIAKWCVEFNTALLDLDGFPEGFDVFEEITREEFLEYAYSCCVRMSSEIMKAWEGEKVG